MAAEKDFNRFEADGQRPDFLETGLSALEGKATEVIREMAETHTLAKDEDLVYVINLIALLAVRNPRARRSLTRSQQQVARTLGEMLVSDRGVWERHQRKARDAGYISGAEVSFERMKAFVDGGQYTIEVAREALIRTELGAFDAVLKSIGTRYWSLLNAAEVAPDFITCDHPITLVFKNPNMNGSIGVGLKNTEMVIPISPRQALRGVFEDPFKPEVTINPLGIAAMNTRIVRHADRQLYSRTPEITVLKGGAIAAFDLRSNPSLQGTPPKRHP